jgi:hypothetical protein
MMNILLNLKQYIQQEAFFFFFFSFFITQNNMYRFSLKLNLNNIHKQQKRKKERKMDTT